MKTENPLEELLGKTPIMIYVLVNGMRVMGEEGFPSPKEGEIWVHGPLMFEDDKLTEYIPGAFDAAHVFDESFIVSRCNAPMNLKKQYAMIANHFYTSKPDPGTDEIEDNPRFHLN